MLNNINYYPVALIAIIGGAVYFLSGNLYNPGSIDYAQYQKVCEQYLAARPGEVSRDAMKSYIYKVDYLLPNPANELTDPGEIRQDLCRQVKRAYGKPGGGGVAVSKVMSKTYLVRA